MTDDQRERLSGRFPTFLCRRADGIVSVDDGDDIQSHEFVDGCKKLLAGAVIVKVGLGHQNLQERRVSYASDVGPTS